MSFAALSFLVEFCYYPIISVSYKASVTERNISAQDKKNHFKKRQSKKKKK